MSKRWLSHPPEAWKWICLTSQGYLYSQEHSLALTHSRGLPGSAYSTATQLHGLPQADNTQKKKNTQPGLRSSMAAAVSLQVRNLKSQYTLVCNCLRTWMNPGVSHPLGLSGGGRVLCKSQKKGSNKRTPIRESHHTFRPEEARSWNWFFHSAVQRCAPEERTHLIVVTHGATTSGRVTCSHKRLRCLERGCVSPGRRMACVASYEDQISATLVAWSGSMTPCKHGCFQGQI